MSLSGATPDQGLQDPLPDEDLHDAKLYADTEEAPYDESEFGDDDDDSGYASPMEDEGRDIFDDVDFIGDSDDDDDFECDSDGTDDNKALDSHRGRSRPKGASSVAESLHSKPLLLELQPATSNVLWSRVTLPIAHDGIELWLFEPAGGASWNK
jgi:hypothetical protein